MDDAPNVSLGPNVGNKFDIYRTIRETLPDYWPISTLADFFGVNSRTLRAQAAAGHIPEPSKTARQGSLSLQVYSHSEAIAVQEWYLKTKKPLKRILDPTRNLGEQEW